LLIGTTNGFKNKLPCLQGFQNAIPLKGVEVGKKIAQEVDLISSGQQVVTINASADYQLSPRVNFRFFLDRTLNNPFLSNQFVNVNTNGGISLRVMLR